MSAKFYTLLTDIGAAKLASAAALGVPLKITHMAVGSGGGVLPTPNAQQTALVAEERRAALNMLYIDPQNSSQVIAEQVIPENEGGWWIREVGLFDETGALIAAGNCPESYKPKLAEGSGRTQTVRMVLITSSTDNITLKIDPAVVLATRKYVDDKVLELKVYVDDLMAKHLAAVDPHSQYAPKDSPTLTGMPKTPTPPAGNNSTLIASTAFVQAAILALIGGAPATLDTLKEIAAAINNDPNFSTTINNALALKAPLASPALTGTPTAPTAAQTVNNTQIATTAFVKAAIAGLVGSSPEALDTLNELAAALGNDPNFATTVMNALAGKQPLDATLTNLSGKSISGLLEYLGLPTLLDAKIRGDTCEVAGFVNGRASAPYMRNKTSDSVVQLATSESVNSGIPMIGVPFFWPSASMPNTLIPEWSDMVFLKLNNATFSAATYPKLALIWPSLTLTESRGEFIRIWDDGRGVDQGRGLLSAQSDAIRNITGSLAGVAALESSAASGFVSQTQSSNPKRIATGISSDEMRIADLQFSAVNAGVPTANENRPRNISFNFIVRAA